MAVSLTSDTYHEFSCTPCSEEDINKEAVVFCVNCTQYFCKACLRFHNRVADAKKHQLLTEKEFSHTTTTGNKSGSPDLRKHQVTDKDQFQHTSTSVNKGEKSDLSTDKCQNHNGKFIDMYCEDHDDIGCNVCMTLEHRNCKCLHFIPDIASSHLSQGTIQTLSKNLSDRLDEFNNLKENRRANKTRVANEKDALLDRIKERRKEIDENLDREEKTLNDSVTDKHLEINAKLDHDMETCDELIKILGSVKGNLQTPKDKNTLQTFIGLKHAERAMKETTGKLGDLKGNRNDLYTLIYEVGPAVEEVLSADTTFGYIESGYKTPNTLDSEEDINVRMDSDKSVCNCEGLCQLPDGTIIITDWNNKNLKSLKYDNTYNQSDSLSMPDSPFGVCTVDDDKVAVTVPNAKKVFLVSVNPKMIVKSSFKVNKSCHGIACADGYLYVGHLFNSRLTVYNLQGKCLKTFTTDTNGEALFEKPCHLCLNSTEEEIIVADGKKGIVIVNESGDLVAEFTYPNYDFTHGVCVDDRNNVYISNFFSKRILVSDSDGTVTSLLDNLSGKPKAVLFDKPRQRLLATFMDEDEIRSFSLQYNSI